MNSELSKLLQSESQAYASVNVLRVLTLLNYLAKGPIGPSLERLMDYSGDPMSAKLDHLERTVLELGTEIYRVRHRMDLLEQDNSHYQQIFISLRKVLDEKGLIGLEDFDDAVALDRILARQSHSQGEMQSLLGCDELKKAVN